MRQQHLVGDHRATSAFCMVPSDPCPATDVAPLCLTKNEMIVMLPDVLRPRTVAAQPEHVLDASQIETFRKVVVFSQFLRRDGDGAAGRLVSPDGLSPIAFGL